MGLYVEGATFDTPQLCCGVVHSNELQEAASGTEPAKKQRTGTGPIMLRMPHQRLEKAGVRFFCVPEKFVACKEIYPDI